MHTIDRLNAGLETLRGRGVRVRYLQDAPVTYGLWRIGAQQVLFLDEASTAAEQLPVVAAAVLQLLDHAANENPPATFAPRAPSKRVHNDG